IGAAARAPLRRVSARHGRVQEDERRLRPHVRRASSGPNDGAGGRASRRRAARGDRRHRLRAIAPAARRHSRHKVSKDTKAERERMSEIEFAAPAAAPRLWTTIRQSIAGSHHGEYTEGPLGRAILLLAIPMVLELVLESVFAVVDVFFVSRLGADAVATVGLTESMLTIIYAVAIGLSAGATATVARRIGERDPEGAARAAVQAIALGLLVAIPLGL